MTARFAILLPGVAYHAGHAITPPPLAQRAAATQSVCGVSQRMALVLANGGLDTTMDALAVARAWKLLRIETNAARAAGVLR